MGLTEGHREKRLSNMELAIKLRDARESGRMVYVERIYDEALARGAALAEAERDIQAYRGALGYPTPSEYDGRLHDRTFPINGIAEALEEENTRLREREKVCTETHWVTVPADGWGGKEVVEKLRRLEKMESEGRYLTPEQVHQVREGLIASNAALDILENLDPRLLEHDSVAVARDAIEPALSLLGGGEE